MSSPDICCLALRIGAVFMGLSVALSLVDLAALTPGFAASASTTAQRSTPFLFGIAIKASIAIGLHAGARRCAALIGDGRVTTPVEDRFAVGPIALRTAGVVALDRAIQRLASAWSGAGLATPRAEWTTELDVAGLRWLPPLALAGLGAWLAVHPARPSAWILGVAPIQPVRDAVWPRLVVCALLAAWFLARASPLTLPTDAGLDGTTPATGRETPAVTAVVAYVRLWIGVLLVLGSIRLALEWRRLGSKRARGIAVRSRSSRAH